MRKDGHTTGKYDCEEAVMMQGFCFSFDGGFSFSAFCFAACLFFSLLLIHTAGIAFLSSYVTIQPAHHCCLCYYRNSI